MMQCVVIATGYSPGLGGLNERYPVPLAPLLDRPFLQHIVEMLIDKGIHKIDFVMSHLPEPIEALLGDGTRWGSEFTFHLVRDPQRPYEALRSIKIDDDPVLIVHADRLPKVDLAGTIPASEEELPCLICSVNESSKRTDWTGWAWVSRASLASLDFGLDERGFEAHIRSTAKGAVHSVLTSICLRVGSLSELQQANKHLLTEKFPGLLLSGRETERGIRLARNTRVHPTARLRPPVFIGENSMVGKNVVIGPNAVLGRNCVVDSHTVVENSIILANTYVGQSLELDGTVCDRDRIINVGLDSEIQIVDDFILSELAEGQLRHLLCRALTRLTAVALFAAGLPIFLAIALYFRLTRQGPVLYAKEFVPTPAPTQEVGWRTCRVRSFLPVNTQVNGVLQRLFLTILPGLVNIASGDLGFVGVTPRSREEIEALPSYWKTLHIGARSGLVTEAAARQAVDVNNDELYLAEAFYAAQTSAFYPLRLVAQYVFGSMDKTRDESAEQSEIPSH